MSWSAPGLSPVSALVVEPDEADRMFFVSALTSAGFEVIEAENFRSARACLAAQIPPLLITEIRLGPYNGLHLAIIGRMMRPHMSLVVTSRCRDRILERCGDAVGAVFVQKPMTERELFTALFLAALREPGTPRAGAPFRPALEGRHHEHDESAAAIRAGRRRRCKRRRRDIATFLLLEALRR